MAPSFGWLVRVGRRVRPAGHRSLSSVHGAVTGTNGSLNGPTRRTFCPLRDVVLRRGFAGGRAVLALALAVASKEGSARDEFSDVGAGGGVE